MVLAPFFTPGSQPNALGTSYDTSMKAKLDLASAASDTVLFTLLDGRASPCAARKVP